VCVLLLLLLLLLCVLLLLMLLCAPRHAHTAAHRLAILD
jgi:hypothetical protein